MTTRWLPNGVPQTRTAEIAAAKGTFRLAFGIGDFGKEARRFVDFLAAAGQTFWQIMPLTPTGYGDSPYQSLSSFAGNGLLISPDWLIEEELLEESECAPPSRLR